MQHLQIRVHTQLQVQYTVSAPCTCKVLQYNSTKHGPSKPEERGKKSVKCGPTFHVFPSWIFNIGCYRKM